MTRPGRGPGPDGEPRRGPGAHPGPGGDPGGHVGPGSGGDPGGRDVAALQRRVLLAGAVALGSFFVLGYVLTAVDAPPVLVLPALLVVVLLVVRPIMAPVLQADRERRRRAYAGFRAERAAEQQERGR